MAVLQSCENKWTMRTNKPLSNLQGMSSGYTNRLYSANASF